VGALFDFLAGEVVRAPALVRRLRLEWAFRLAQEPGRLWRRYVLGNPAFLARVFAQKLSDQPGIARLLRTGSWRAR
jgi:UDP-N-acetyl-D-mannosaminuronic acid transferase (WecB/TagA/CpsF family)